MRIVAGEWRGRALTAPPGRETRPTPDRVREAVFSALGDRVSGARFLDLFAGTGAMGLEAVSRGAASAVLVESEREALAAIERNVAALGAADRVTIVRVAAASALELLALGGEPIQPFDLAYADPPYRFDDWANLLERLVAPEILAPGAWLLAEHGAKMKLPDVTGLNAIKYKKYGDTAVTFLARE